MKKAYRIFIILTCAVVLCGFSCSFVMAEEEEEEEDSALADPGDCQVAKADDSYTGPSVQPTTKDNDNQKKAGDNYNPPGGFYLDVTPTSSDLSKIPQGIYTTATPDHKEREVYVGPPSGMTDTGTRPWTSSNPQVSDFLANNPYGVFQDANGNRLYIGSPTYRASSDAYTSKIGLPKKMIQISIVWKKYFIGDR